jgi:hypothetical protein
MKTIWPVRTRTTGPLFMGTALLAALGSVVAVPPARAQDIQPHSEFRIRLLAPISTRTNQKGDKITAQISSPAEFAGGMMEGEVRDSKSGAKLKGTSVLTFTFTTVFKDGKKTAVSSDVRGFVNSHGQANVDEEGRVIEQKNNVGKVAVATGLGAIIGAMTGGAKGAAIGAGIGGAASLILVQMAAKAPDISFGPGTEFILSVSPRQK